MPFTVQATGLTEAIAATQRRIEALNDLRPALEAARQAFGEVERQHFASRGSGTWAANTERTTRYKAQLGVSGPVMVRTGTLEASLGNPETFNATPMSIEVGTSVRYAIFHQQGFAQRWRLEEIGNDRLALRRSPLPMMQPPRRVIDLAASGVRPIVQAFTDALRKLVGTAS